MIAISNILKVGKYRRSTSAHHLLKLLLPKAAPVLAGVDARVRRSPTAVLALLYDPEHLQATLLRPEHRAFLAQRGFRDDSSESLLDSLEARFRAGTTGFAHEVGIFLGYPLNRLHAA